MVKRICIVFAGLSDVKLSDKLIPLRRSGLFDEIHVQRDTPGVQIPDVVYHPTPGFLQRFVIFSIIYRFLAGLILSYLNRRSTTTIISYYCIPHGVIAYLVSRISGSKLVTCLIGDDINIGLKSMVLEPIVHLVSRASNRVVVTGSASAEIIRFHGYSQVRVVRNTIDTEKFKPIDKEQILELSLIIVGSLTRNKRIDRTFQLVKELHDRGVWIKCRIVGSGPERKSLSHLISESGLQEWVKFVGYRNDISNLLPTQSALCLFSENEGFPAVIAEALCSGLPVLAIGTGDIIDLAGSSSPLFIYSPQWNPQFFADAVEKLLCSPISLSDRLVEASQFRELFSYASGGNLWRQALIM